MPGVRAVEGGVVEGLYGLVDDGDARGVDVVELDDVGFGRAAYGNDVVGVAAGVTKLEVVDLSVVPVVHGLEGAESYVVHGDEGRDVAFLEAERNFVAEAVEDVGVELLEVGGLEGGAPEATGDATTRQDGAAKGVGEVRDGDGIGADAGSEEEVFILREIEGEGVDYGAAVVAETGEVVEEPLGIESYVHTGTVWRFKESENKADHGRMRAIVFPFWTLRR